MKQLLVKAVHLADQVCEAADEATSFKQDCSELKSKTDKLASLLRTAARASANLYERPTRCIIVDTHQVLDKALSLVLKCRANALLKRVFHIISTNAFRKTSSLLENSTANVSWLLRVSTLADTHLGLPPITAKIPILGLIWEHISILCTGSLEDRSDAAASLVSIIRDDDRYRKLIMKEGGVGPLLKLIKEGTIEGQENGARAIGLLGCDHESVELIVNIGVCSVFAEVLKEGPMKVQCVVAWAVSQLVANNPNCRHKFAQHNILSLLVSHLAFETVQERSECATITNTPTLVHALVMGSSNNNSDNVKTRNYEDEEKLILNQTPNPFDSNAKAINQLYWVISSTIAVHNAATKLQDNNNKANEGNKNYQYHNNYSTKNNDNSKQGHHHQHSYSHSGVKMKGRELEDLETKASMKEMAARALWQLVKGNSQICGIITRSRALLCFAILLERGPKAVQYNSAMALMEITAVVEKDVDLRRSAFKPNSPACKAVADQMVKIVEKEDSDLLIPCVKAIGNLAKTFKATESRMIGPLVRLLDEREVEVMKESIISLTKFVCTGNYLHIDHSKAIISAGGSKHLIHLVYFGEKMVRKPALVLLSYIALHVPDSKELAQDRVVGVLEWASKQAFMTRDETLEALLQESKSKLERYQARGSRGFQKSKSKLENYQSRGSRRFHNSKSLPHFY